MIMPGYYHGDEAQTAYIHAVDSKYTHPMFERLLVQDIYFDSSHQISIKFPGKVLS